MINFILALRSFRILSFWKRLKLFLNFFIHYQALSSEDKKIVYEIMEEKYVYQTFKSLSYLTATQNFSRDNVSSINHCPKIVWRLWYQGESEQPDIVKACTRSVEKYACSGDISEIVLLDKKNIENYIEIPGFIYDKKNNGKISNVNFSDILRSFLLAEHGGIWMDATVYLTDVIPSFLCNRPLFAFSVTPSDLCGQGTLLASSWFICSRKNTELMRTLKQLMIEFWRLQDNSCHHYYFHLLFRLAVESNLLATEEWSQVPFFSNVPPHVLQLELFNVYNVERFKQIKEMTPIHKLTFYGLNFNSKREDTFYKFLMKS